MRWELISPLLLLVVWQLLAMVFPGRLFPTPIAVAIELWTDLVDGKLISDMAKTLRRAAISFAIAMTIGIAIGILFGRVRIADRLFSTWVIVGLNLPAVVIAIVLYISLGLTETAIVLAVIIGGALMAGGLVMVTDIASGGQKTIQDLGGGFIVFQSFVGLVH